MDLRAVYMEAALARLARQPGKRDGFLLWLYENISPACRDNFVILILFWQ
jgi:hypothetical protein